MKNQKTVAQMLGVGKFTLVGKSNNPELFQRLLHKDTVIAVNITFITAEGEAITVEAFTDELEWIATDAETGELLEV